MEKATFGAGCFWGVEAAFRQNKGVSSTAVGYEGGSFDKPTYQDVCTDKTGHVEVVQVEYDPAQVSYEQLLDVFWSDRDPTTEKPARAGRRLQYRSVIFYHTPEQEKAAIASKQRLEQGSAYRKPVVTEIVPAATFSRKRSITSSISGSGMSSCHVR